MTHSKHILFTIYFLVAVSRLVHAQCNYPDIDFGNDTTLCPGQTLVLNAGVHTSYLWNNNSTAATKLVSLPGTYYVRTTDLGGNIIVNGDFEQGNMGFSTAYTPGTGGTFGVLSNEGTYAITTSPNLVHNNFTTCNDHTTNPGVNQLVVNGSANPNTQVWCQTVPVQTNTNYQFGTWVSSAVTDPNVAQLQFSINSVNLGNPFSPSPQSCNWSQFFQTWNSGLVTTAQICIVNQNTGGSGNDFALDDISFRPVCYNYDTIIVTYAQNPVVNLGSDQTVCEGTTLVLDAQNPTSNFLWNTNQTTQQISVTTTGNYSVTVTSAAGCVGSDNISITYEMAPVAGNDSIATFCTTENSFELSDLLSTNATLNGNWTSQNFSGNTSLSGTISAFGMGGTSNFLYIVPGTFCPNDTAQFQLQINTQPIAATNQFIHLCADANDLTAITTLVNHPSSPNGGSWEYSPNFVTSSFNESTLEINPATLQHGDYWLQFVLSPDSMCVSDTFKLDLHITAMPIIAFGTTLDEGCVPLAVTFENQSTTQGVTTVIWDLGDGTTSTSSQGLNHLYTNPNCYPVTLTITADNLCTSTLTIPDRICVHPNPVAAFTYGPQQLYSDGPTTEFDNSSTNNSQNYWFFGDGSSSTTENPTHTYPTGEIGSYLATLVVVSEFGCIDSTSQFVLVKDQLLYYVPNTFTPNGDPFNTIFIPVLTAGMDFNDYTLEIFNRWGESIFFTNNFSEGWDGTYKGVMVPDGIYTWVMQFGLIENDGREEVRGHVTLMR